MSHRRYGAVVVLVPFGLAVAMGACGDTLVFQGATTAAGGHGGTDSGAGGNGGSLFGGNGATGCKSDADCDGGVCSNAGECCASAELVCGAGCCESGSVCLFDQCVQPGEPCVSAVDCPEGHYCEPALGSDDPGGAGGGNCTQPLDSGLCLPLPPVCEDGQDETDDCIPKCEFHPTAGQLNAVIKWQWGHDPAPTSFPSHADVWSTPTVARIHDANCDGKVDLADPPNIVFVSGDAERNQCCNASVMSCRQGVLRMLDGKSGQEVWSLDEPESGSAGFAASSIAIGDVDGDGRIDIVALSGEGKVVVVNHAGEVTHISSELVDGAGETCLGWGGGIALGDMDNDGWPEIAYARSVFTMDDGQLGHLFTGNQGWGGVDRRRSHNYFVDLDGDGGLELLAGRTAYRHDGTTLWNNTGNALDGNTAVGDFTGDGEPEVAVVRGGSLRILAGATGVTLLGPVDVPGVGEGGPPTIADFDGDGALEVSVAMQNLYSVLKPDFEANTIDVLWSQVNHDASSSVTGSSVFDFEGDGRAEVIYNDECYLWVYDGTSGDVLFTANTQSFTGTEASIVADVDGDGRAEIVMVSNGANTSIWHCAHHNDPSGTYPVWSPPANAPDHRGITIFGDSANSWVGTRTLWNQHAYHVTNICDPRDSACDPGSYYGQIPANQKNNWDLPWLNNFRQNVQDAGLFDAPDAVVSLSAQCVHPVKMQVSVRNAGVASLPAGVEVGVYRLASPGDALLGTVVSTKGLLPGQTEVLDFTAPAGDASTADSFQARVHVDPVNPTFNECRDDNNDSAVVSPECVN